MTLESVERKWVFVPDSSKYQISNYGEFQNISTGNVLKHAIDRYGYPKISYRDDNGKISILPSIDLLV